MAPTLRLFSLPGVDLAEDLLLRLQPVIQGALTDTAFVEFVGARGDQWVERVRHGRWGNSSCRVAGGSLARRFRFGRFLRSHGVHPWGPHASPRSPGTEIQGGDHPSSTQCGEGQSERPYRLGRSEIADEEVSARDDADEPAVRVHHGNSDEMFALQQRNDLQRGRLLGHRDDALVH